MRTDLDLAQGVVCLKKMDGEMRQIVGTWVIHVV